MVRITQPKALQAQNQLIIHDVLGASVHVKTNPGAQLSQAFTDRLSSRCPLYSLSRVSVGNFFADKPQGHTGGSELASSAVHKPLQLSVSVLLLWKTSRISSTGLLEQATAR